MNQELVDKAIDAAAKSVMQANDAAQRAEMRKNIVELTARVGAISNDGDVPTATLLNLALLGQVAYLLEEQSNLLRAIVAHTGAALPGEGQNTTLVDMFAQAIPQPPITEDVQLVGNLVDVPA